MQDDLIKQTFSVSTGTDNLITIDFKKVVEPEDTTRLAQLVEDAIFEILNKDPNKTYNALLDISAIGGSYYLSPEAKNIYLNLAKLRQLKKSALVGNNTFIELFVNLAVSAAGKDMNFKWFSKREEALNWINNE